MVRPTRVIIPNSNIYNIFIFKIVIDRVRETNIYDPGDIHESGILKF